VEDFCSVEPVTHPPEFVERRPLADLDEDKLRSIYNERVIESGILGGVLALLFLAILIVGLLICRRVWGGEKGVYMTQEDEGCQDVGTSDEAVLGGVTGSRVEGGKREWFI